MTTTILNDGTADISGSGSAPTAFDLALGTSQLSNSVVNAAGADGLPEQDVDIFSVTVADGEILSEVVLSNFQSTDNVGFVGVVEGSAFPADALAADFDTSQLLGQTLFGTGSAADLNDNILVALGNGAGAIGFDGSAGLSAGTYTFLVQQLGGASIDYTLDFNVSSLTGDASANVLDGGAGDDVILGGAGDDILNGNDGNDLLAGGGGTDVIDGGTGNDTNSFEGIGFDVEATVNADGTGTAAYGPVNETFTGIENLTGSSNDDVLIATGAAANILIGGDGNDILAGGGGTDVIDGGAGIDTNSFQGIGFDVVATINEDGTGAAAYGPVNETFTGIENLAGSDNNDTLTGNSDANVLSGNAGDDTLVGGAGDDILAGGGGTDIIDGGAGNDTNSFEGIGLGVEATVNADGTGTAAYGSVNETFTGIENLTGTSNDDVLVATGAAANTLDGGEGNDLLAGGGGTDIIDGGGTDIIDGGAGIDTNSFQGIGLGVTATVAADGTGTAVYGSINESFVNIENLDGSDNDDVLSATGAADNVLSGADGNDTLNGGAGADVLNGGAGNDILNGDTEVSGQAITVTVTNTLGEGGTFLTPVWFAFHDGEEFDLFTEGEAASAGLESIAEDGSFATLGAEFSQTVGDSGVASAIFGPAGFGGAPIIDPGEVASTTINVDPTAVGQGFFTWATMVIPSNDAFLASPDDPLADSIFDENGNFIGPIVIRRFGEDVLDAGTEVNTELDAAFLNQPPTAANVGVTENGVVGQHVGFNGSEGNPDGTPVNILGATNPPGFTFTDEADFTRDGGSDQILEIRIDLAEGGDDILNGGAGDDTLRGGEGNDTLNGGDGFDTAVYDDIDVPIIVDLDENGNGTVTRETGFSISSEGDLSSLTTEQSTADLVAEALAGNLYYNVHTDSVVSGEIRGQLNVSRNAVLNGVQTIILTATLDSAQEPGNTSDSEATGLGEVVITVAEDGTATYTSNLSIEGIATSELTPVAGVSAIHIHNAPAGVNGPVILDVVQDAGGDVNGVAQDEASDSGDGNVFVETVEVDTLTSIENIVFDDDDADDVVTGADNVVDNDPIFADVVSGFDGQSFIEVDDGDQLIFENAMFATADIVENGQNLVVPGAEFTTDADFGSGGFLAASDGTNTTIQFLDDLAGDGVDLLEGQAVAADEIDGVSFAEYVEGNGTLENSTSGFENSFGVFVFDEASNQVSDVQLVAANAQDGGSATVSNVAEGQQLGFFIVQDGASDTFEFTGSTLTDLSNASAAEVFQSIDVAANSDAQQHFLSGLSDDGALRVGAEDLTGLGDSDFQDVVFTVSRMEDDGFAVV